MQHKLRCFFRRLKKCQHKACQYKTLSTSIPDLCHSFETGIGWNFKVFHYYEGLWNLRGVTYFGVILIISGRILFYVLSVNLTGYDNNRSEIKCFG